MAHLPSVLEALLTAEAEFERALLDAAPLPEGDAKARDHLELVDQYHRYIPSAELRWIAMLLFQLRAYGVTDAEAMRRFIGLHNEHVQTLAADPEYCRRKRLPAQRLLEAAFSRGATENACINLEVYGRGRVAFDASTMKRLMVEFVGRDHIDRILTLLERIGLLASVRGNYNAHVFIATGRLEDLFMQYLSDVDRGVTAAGGKPGQAEERQ
jgi:hypothetical protein